MGQVQQVLAELGRSMGLEDWLPEDGQGAQLRLESGALLGVTENADEAVLHYAEPVAYNVVALVLKAMQKLARANSAADPVQFGVRSTQQGQWLVVCTRMPLHQFSLSELQRLGSYLQSWLAFAREPG